jgi:acyl carrier protein
LRTGDSVSAHDVRAALLDELSEPLAAIGLDAGSVPDDFDLLVEGVIDSFGILELVSALEARYLTTLDFSELPVSDLTVVGPLSEHIAAQIRAAAG